MAQPRGRPAKQEVRTSVGQQVVLNSLAVASMLGCSDRAAAALMRDGKIASHEVGKSWRTTEQAVLHYLEQLSPKPEETR